MLRQHAHPHALLSPRPPRSIGRAWRTGARGLRAVLAPLAALGAALAGLVFLILLPIWGVASVAQGIAAASWRAAKRLAREPAQAPPQD